jgi:hypothetical protein
VPWSGGTDVDIPRLIVIFAVEFIERVSCLCLVISASVCGSDRRKDIKLKVANRSAEQRRVGPISRLRLLIITRDRYLPSLEDIRGPVFSFC